MLEFYILLWILILGFWVWLFFIIQEKKNEKQSLQSLHKKQKIKHITVSELLWIQWRSLKDSVIKQEVVLSIQKKLESKIIGQPNFTIVLLLALFSWSHVFIQSLPGLAKTSAVKYLCELVWLSFGRIQWTPDLLPSDITGFEMADGTVKLWVINNNLILFDEINRSTPKLQSAILQAMEEKSITLWMHHLLLPNPFIVFATANPSGSRGVYGLPEAQMDRFGLSIILDYPENEKEILIWNTSVVQWDAAWWSIDFKNCSEGIDGVTIDSVLIDLITMYLQHTRESESVAVWCSPRAGKDLIHLAKTFARMQNKNSVSKDDIDMLLNYVWWHRIAWC